MMEQDGQNMELVFFPWPGHKPSEQERDPFSVQSRIWEWHFSAGKDRSPVRNGLLSTSSSEMTWRFRCLLGSPARATQ